MFHKVEVQLVHAIGLDVPQCNLLLVEPLGLEELPVVHVSLLPVADVGYENEARVEPVCLRLVRARSLALLDPDLICAPFSPHLVVLLVKPLARMMAQGEVPLGGPPEGEQLLCDLDLLLDAQVESVAAVVDA